MYRDIWRIKVKRQTEQTPTGTLTNAKNRGIKTTCPYCGVGCGINVMKDKKTVILGDKDHPANFGSLCIKGKNLGETLNHQDRLSQPLVKNFPQTWSRALDHVANRFNQVIEQHGPDAVAFYVSGQLLTEDYYLANKLMKGFIGSGNIDSNSRLCMASAVVGHKQAFGEDIVPLSYSDVIKTDLIVLVGSNLAWCHPVLHQRIMAEKKRRPELFLLVIDPRLTATAAMADLHLSIKSGGDLLLFNGLLDHLNKQKKITTSADGLEKALENAALDSHKLSETGIDLQTIKRFFQLFSDKDKVVTLFSQGINQSSRGSDQCNAIINCHLASGKIGREGCGPFSITGQPNAMGGREVGALANTLASHMEFNNVEHYQILTKFWQTENLATKPGLKAIDLFDAIAVGKIKAIWIMATNPLVSLPDSNKVKQALKLCPLVVVSDCVSSNDTLDYADVILPTYSWGEKDGTVTNSERRISRQRAFMTPYEGAKADWWIINEVARKMGFNKAFNYKTPSEIFSEHAKLSGTNNNGSRAFDISGLAGISERDYQQMLPIQWPQPAGKRLVLDDQLLFTDGHYFTTNHKPQMLAVSATPVDPQPLESTLALKLNTGRYRDQWHTQTRTGMSATLSHSHPEPLLDLHPIDVKKFSLQDNQLALLKNTSGETLIRVRSTNSQRQGELFTAIHWSDNNSNQGAINRLISAVSDPYSGQPALKCCEIELTPWEHGSEAMLIVNKPIEITGVDYQVRQKIVGGYCYHLADLQNSQQLFNNLVNLIEEVYPQPISKLNAINPASLSYRQYYYQGNKFIAALVVDAQKSKLAEGWLSRFFQLPVENQNKQMLISSDIQAQRQQKTFCHCLKVSFQQLQRQIDSGILNVHDIKKLTGAGNGCGSCVADIELLFKEQVVLC